MRIGIFGGSFNPVHNKHIAIAEDLINKGYLDEVIFVPTGINYKYKNNLVPDKDRYNMLLIATNHNDCLKVSNYEQQGYLVYTYETLNHFRDIYSNSSIYFVCGADNLNYIDKWENGLYLLKNYKFIVIGRGDYDLDLLLEKYSEFRDNIIISDIDTSDISSTFIREHINDDDINDYLNPKVKKYIKQRRLY